MNPDLDQDSYHNFRFLITLLFIKIERRMIPLNEAWFEGSNSGYLFYGYIMIMGDVMIKNLKILSFHHFNHRFLFYIPSNEYIMSGVHCV